MSNDFKKPPPSLPRLLSPPCVCTFTSIGVVCDTMRVCMRECTNKSTYGSRCVYPLILLYLVCLPPQPTVPGLFAPLNLLYLVCLLPSTYYTWCVCPLNLLYLVCLPPQPTVPGVFAPLNLLYLVCLLPSTYCTWCVCSPQPSLGTCRCLGTNWKSPPRQT